MSKKVLLCVTGSVAAKLTKKIANKIAAAGHDVQIAATQPSLYFFDEAELTKAGFKIWKDTDEWQNLKYAEGDEIRHVELCNWADLLLIAPLTANTLGKMANGLEDNLVSCTARAWDNEKPLVIAPAMNTKMWNHFSTAEHIGKLSGWYSPKFEVVYPIEGKLACGDTGIGALAKIDDIVATVDYLLK